MPALNQGRDNCYLRYSFPYNTLASLTQFLEVRFMTKDELVAKVSESTGVKKVDLQKALESIIQTIIETIKTGDKVNITGLGIFKLKDKKARMARNPKTGESISVPAKKAPKFLPAKNFKEAVK